MSKWSGRGIPPTRRKLHRLRAAQVKAARLAEKDHQSDLAYREFTWSRKIRKAIINPEQFERMWCR